MKMNSLSVKLLLLLTPILMMTACELKTPIKEMTDARLKISEAKEWQAPKYAEEEITKAEQMLLDSHSDLRDKDEKIAADTANKSRDMAQSALDKTLPLYATDIITELHHKGDEAQKLGAERFTTDEYKNLTGEITAVDSLNSEQKYKEAIIKGRETIVAADRIIEICMSQIPNMQERVTSLKTNLEKLNENSFKDTASEELTTIENGIPETEGLIESKDLKLAFDNIEKLEAIYLIAAKKVSIAQLDTDINRLDKNIAELKNNKDSSFAETELNAAQTSIDAAKTKLAEEDLESAYNSKVEAQTAIQEATQKIMAGSVGAKINKIQKEFNLANSSDVNKYFIDELTKISTDVATCTADYNNGNYTEANQKADPVIEQLDALLLAMEKKREELRLAAEEAAKKEADLNKSKEVAPDTTRIYVVKYNPKNRDCLWKIADREYKDAKLWPLIYIANKEQIKDPDLIFPGQKFKIPPKPVKGEKVKPVEPTDSKPATDTKDNTVSPTPTTNSTVTTPSSPDEKPVETLPTKNPDPGIE